MMGTERANRGNVYERTKERATDGRGGLGEGHNSAEGEVKFVLYCKLMQAELAGSTGSGRCAKLSRRAAGRGWGRAGCEGAPPAWTVRGQAGRGAPPAQGLLHGKVQLWAGRGVNTERMNVQARQAAHPNA